MTDSLSKSLKGHSMPPDDQYTFLSHLNESVLVIDKDDTIVFANQPFCDLCSTTSDKIMGEKCHEILSPSPFLYGGKGGHEQQSIHQQVMTNGLPVSVNHSHTMADGTKKFLQISASPLKDDKGEVLRIICVITDLTQGLKRQDSLTATIAKHEAIWNNAPFYFSCLDREMRVIRLSPLMNQFTEYRSEEVKSRYRYDAWGQHAHDTEKKRKGEDLRCLQGTICSSRQPVL